MHSYYRWMGEVHDVVSFSLNHLTSFFMTIKVVVTGGAEKSPDALSTTTSARAADVIVVYRKSESPPSELSGFRLITQGTEAVLSLQHGFVLKVG
jgi:hypothetical protein